MDERSTPDELGNPQAPDPRSGILKSVFGAALVLFLLFQGMHVLEHVVQVVQLRLLHLPKGDAHGVISSFDNEWVHFSWNFAVFITLAAMTSLRRHAVLVFATLLSGVHLVEHGLLLRQFLVTGSQGAGVLARGGLLFGEDGWLPRPEVHLLYNAAEFLPVLVVLLLLWSGRRTQPPRAGVWLRGWVGLVILATLVGASVPNATFFQSKTKSAVTFSDVTNASGANNNHPKALRQRTGGGDVAVADFNRDGYLDVYVTSGIGLSRLLLNDGHGVFTDVATAAGVSNAGNKAQGACWGDYDNDGWPDLFVANHAVGRSTLYRNLKDGTFKDVSAQARLLRETEDLNSGKGCAWGDFDGDGHLDLAVVRFVSRAQRNTMRLGSMTNEELATFLRPLSLYRNLGDGTFTDTVEQLGNVRQYPGPVNGLGFKPLFFDYNSDGRPDLYIVNDFGRENYPNVMFRNEGPGADGKWRWTDVSKASGTGVAVYGMGVAVADYDGDGILDLYVSNIGDAILLRGRKDGTYEDRADAARAGIGTEPDERLASSWGVAFWDYDNDGLVDLYRADGPNSMDVFGALDKPNPDAAIRQEHAPQGSHLLRNRGDGRFTDVSAAAGVNYEGRGRAAVPFDMDNDGDLDLLLLDLDETLTLFRNEGTPGHWLQLRLVGTKSNRDALGARITITAGGRSQVRELGTAFAYMSSSLLPEHFGLGALTSIDLIEIRWPSGLVQRLADVRVDQLLEVVEPQGH